MKITVSSKNEFEFYPDIAGNLELEPSKRFTIIVRKLNNVLHSSRWASVDTDGHVDVNLSNRVKEHIVRLVNPPMLDIDGGKSERELAVDDLINPEFSELFDIVEQLVYFINQLQDSGSFETKKS